MAPQKRRRAFKGCNHPCLCQPHSQPLFFGPTVISSCDITTASLVHSWPASLPSNLCFILKGKIIASQSTCFKVPIVNTRIKSVCLLSVEFRTLFDLSPVYLLSSFLIACYSHLNAPHHHIHLLKSPFGSHMSKPLPDPLVGIDHLPFFFFASFKKLVILFPLNLYYKYF